MKQTFVIAIMLVVFSCAENDNRRRKPDPRFATQGCINDSTDQEFFDENGKAYYEYVPCEKTSEPTQTSQKFPCVGDSMETERFDDNGDPYIIKIPCPA